MKIFLSHRYSLFNKNRPIDHKLLFVVECDIVVSRLGKIPEPKNTFKFSFSTPQNCGSVWLIGASQFTSELYYISLNSQRSSRIRRTYTKPRIRSAWQSGLGTKTSDPDDKSITLHGGKTFDLRKGNTHRKFSLTDRRFGYDHLHTFSSNIRLSPRKYQPWPMSIRYYANNTHRSRTGVRYGHSS